MRARVVWSGCRPAQGDAADEVLAAAKETADGLEEQKRRSAQVHSNAGPVPGYSLTV